MSVEAMRGCGYRKVGGLYLCGGGKDTQCDRLPYELVLCPTCGAGVKFTRGWTWLDWYGYAGEHSARQGGLPSNVGGGVFSECSCPPMCPVCCPAIYTPLLAQDKKVYGLLWVGEASYTPKTFTQEALTMGVSRRIAAVPKNLKLGETWVLFAHKKLIRKHTEPDGSNEDVPGIFYVFRPTSLELLIWESQAKPEYLEDLAKRNITPIIIPDGDEDHHPDTKAKISADDREDVSARNRIALLRNSIGR